jgi:oligopeptide transport system substrate-binding protein
MTINKKTIYLVSAIVLSLFLVLGCQLAVRPTPTAAPLTKEDANRAPVEKSTARPSPEEATATPQVQSATPPAPVEVPERNELRLFSPDEPETLDPALVQDMTSHRFVSLLFSGLVTLDSDLKVVPDLAERWEVNESGTIYTFYLNQDAKFHNGQPVTAEDVIYSLERAADPKRGSVKRAESYLDDIVGVKERTSGKAKSISGIKALDTFTVQITIDAPKPYFLAKLTYPTSFVVNRENVEQTRRKWTAQPIGTGPFKMAENGHTQMVLEAFDEYHRGRPKLDRLTFVYRGQSMNLYERGELDVIEVSSEYIDRVLDTTDPLYDDLRIVSQVDVWYIGFNVAKPPFDDPHVRRALAYATNKVAIAEIAFNKMVLPAKGILPPGLPGYNAGLEGLDYDVQRALDEMIQSDYGDATELPAITLTVTGAETGEMLAEMYQQTLGIELDVQVVDWSEFLQGLDAQDYQMFSLGWIGDYPDPQNFLDMLFHSQSAYNHSAYSNPELDALVEQARVEQDTDRRMALYQQAEQILVEDAPWIPLYHSGGYYLVRPYVQGLVISAQETMNLHEVSIGVP